MRPPRSAAVSDAMTKGWRRSCSSRSRFPGTTWRSGAPGRRSRNFWKGGPNGAPLRDRNLLGEIDVLNRVQQSDTFLHRTLEGLTARDESGAASAFVDDGSPNRFLQIALAC